MKTHIILECDFQSQCQLMFIFILTFFYSIRELGRLISCLHFRWRAWMHFVLNFITILLWSIIGVVVGYDKKHNYIMPDHWWRIVLLVSLEIIIIISIMAFCIHLMTVFEPRLVQSNVFKGT